MQVAVTSDVHKYTVLVEPSVLATVLSTPQTRNSTEVLGQLLSSNTQGLQCDRHSIGSLQFPMVFIDSHFTGDPETLSLMFNHPWPLITRLESDMVELKLTLHVIGG